MCRETILTLCLSITLYLYNILCNVVSEIEILIEMGIINNEQNSYSSVTQPVEADETFFKYRYKAPR